MNEMVRIGVVGCGSVMSRCYMELARSLSVDGTAEVVAACDTKEEKRRFVREEFGISNFTTDYRELVNSDEVDAVLVLTSMLEHGPISREALEAGKHVLVEKPMAVTLEEAAGLVELARTSPGHLVCAPHVVLSPTYQAMWRRIRRGEIGKVHLARARYGWAGPWWGQWYYRAGGGPLFDLGVYNVTSLTGWLGPVRRVMAMTGTAIPERVVDDELISVDQEDNYQILLDFGDALFASVTTGFSMQMYRSPAIEVYGGEGTIQMMGDDWAPEGYELWQNSVGAWQIFDETDRSWPWTDGLRHLVECIREDREPVITPEHAYHVLEVMVKAMESGQDGRARTVESTFAPLEFVEERGREAAHLLHDRSH
jgi:predicted dehydrogenase